MTTLARLYDRFLARTARHAGRADAALRVGLGATILLAGLHKLVAPEAWAAYLAPAFADRWPVAADATMVAFGVTEVPFGLLLLADRLVALSAAVVALSMAGVAANLAVGVAQGAGHADVLVRDLGLLALAVGVTLRSVEG